MNWQGLTMFDNKTMDKTQSDAELYALYPVHYTIDYVGYKDNKVVRVSAMFAKFAKPLSGTDLDKLRLEIQKDHSLDFVSFTNIYRHER